MPVHALQGADDDAIFRRRHVKANVRGSGRSRAGGDGTGDGSLFSRFAPGVRCELRPVRADPGTTKFHLLARRSPQLRFVHLRAGMSRPSLELHACGFGIRVEIEIAAQVGPMIQRFDHGDRASALLQGGANLLKKSQRMLDARSFLLRTATCDPFRGLPVSLHVEDAAEADRTHG